MIATTSEDRTRKAQMTDDAWSIFILGIGDELEGRLVITHVDPRPNEVHLTIRDRDTGGTIRLSAGRDLQPRDVRRKILAAAAALLVSGAATQKNIHESRKRGRRKRAG